MRKGRRTNRDNRIIRVKKSAMVYRVLCFIIIVSMALSGCSNIVTGETKPQPIDYSRINDEGGLTKLGLENAKEIKVKINYVEGGDFNANKYESTYVDAFYVAPDLSDELEDISYFNLLDTYESTSNGVTFVYAYRTKKYQNNALRSNKESYTHVEEDETIVMFPDLKDNVKPPVSDESYLVLATYSFAVGKSSYHELARVKSNAEEMCQSKTTYHTSDSLENIADASFVSDYYSLLDKTSLYIFDADNVKAFSNNRQAYMLNQAGETVVATELTDGNVTTGGKGNKTYPVTNSRGSSDLQKVTKAGFYKYVSFEEELNSIANKGLDKLYPDGWDINIYDYSIYTSNRETHIYFEMLLTGDKYNLAVNEEDTPGDYTDSDDESFEYVGNITIKDLPEIEYSVDYYKANKEIGSSDSDKGYYNYIVWPTDTASYVRRRLADNDQEINIYSIDFGSRAILLNEDGTRPLNLIYDGGNPGLLRYGDGEGRSCYFKVSDNVYNEWHFNESDTIINDIKLAQTKINYARRCIDSPNYSYANRKYILVSADYLDNPDTYFDFKEDVYTNSYLVGNLGIKSSFDHIMDKAATIANPDISPKLNLHAGGVQTSEKRHIGIDDSAVFYNAIPDLKLTMQDAVYHNITIKKRKDGLSGQFLFDDVVMLYSTDAAAFFDAFPMQNMSSTAAFEMDRVELSKILNCNVYSDESIAGKLKQVQGRVYNDYLYMTYVFDNQVFIGGTKLSLPNNDPFRGGGFRQSAVSREMVTLDLEKLLIKDDSSIDNLTLDLDKYKSASSNDGTSLDLGKLREGSISDNHVKKVSLGESYKAKYISFFSGMLTKKGEMNGYITSTSPSYGFGLYNIDTKEYSIPTFQRHKISQVITTVEERDKGEFVRSYNTTDAKDEIVSLRKMTCYGIFENTFTKDKDDYPYLLMGYDRDDLTYTDVEMLRAKMVPFGVAYNNNGEYYRDFKPLEGDDCVYYLRDAYYSKNGNRIIDKSQYGGDTTEDEDDPYNPKGDTPGGDKPGKPDDSTIYDDPDDGKGDDGKGGKGDDGKDGKGDDGKDGKGDDGKGGKDDGGKGDGGKGDGGKGDGGKGDGDQGGSGKNDGISDNVIKNPNNNTPKSNRKYGYDGYDEAKRKGFNGIVDDGTPKVEDRSIFSDSVSKDSVSSDKVHDDSSDYSKLKDRNSANSAKSNGRTIAFWVIVILLIIVSLLSLVSFIIYIYRKHKKGY